jgi:protein TonB
MRIAGKVALRIFINEQGGIDMISIMAAAPPGVFDEAALTATQALQFTPALKNGREVKSQKTIEVVFNPYERIAIP